MIASSLTAARRLVGLGVNGNHLVLRIYKCLQMTGSEIRRTGKNNT